MISITVLQSRPRLFHCTLLGVATWAVLPQFMALQEVTRIIVGWNAGACLYLGLVAWMMGSSSHERMRQRALAGQTVFTSWAFTQVMFALHCAHDYHVSVIAGQPGGLAFPGEHPPDYGDFVYFACVIGTSGQTADVSFTNRRMRRTGLLHCVLAFFFNTTLVALSINIASGLV